MKIKLANKLVALFLAVSVVPLAIAGFIAYRQASDALRETKLERLDVLAQERVNRLERLFRERKADVVLMARIPAVRTALDDFGRSFANGGLTGPEYLAAQAKHEDLLSAFVDTEKIHDMLLIGPDGDVVFTVSKERDLGTNLRTGRYKDTELAHVFDAALAENRVVVSRIRYFDPSRAPAVFIAAPIGRGDDLAGVVAIEMPMTSIYEVAADYAGLGDTGETTIISAGEKEMVWVAPTRHDPAAAFTRKVPLGSKSAIPAQEVARGVSGRGTHPDYRGVPVLAAWRHVPTLRLGLVLKMDEAEALAPIRALSIWFAFLGLGTLVAVSAVSGLIARSISRPVLALIGATERMAAGDLDTRADLRGGDEIGDLGSAFNTMAERLERQSRQREGQNKLNEEMRGEKSLSVLADEVVACVARHIGAQVGALFVAEHGRLHLTGRFAYRTHEAVPDVFALGEGLVGRAAAEKSAVLLSDVPEDYILVGSALGQTAPRHILAVPLPFENEIKGVVELGALEPFSEQHREYLEVVAGAIGIALQTVQSRERTQQLLEESQRLSEELQAQQEELKAANEELEERTQRLQESEGRLKTQQEELEVTNEELEEKNDLLERRKREAERARIDLAEQAAELALASKYKSEFLANMSHELRSPLNSLLLLAQGLSENKKGNLRPEQVESAKIIHGSGSELLSLINEVLDLSKIEAGRMDLHLGAVRVADLADAVRATFGHMASDKGLTLDIVVRDDAPPEIASDRKRIEQILRNLMSNALKFTEKGGVSVTFGRGSLVSGHSSLGTRKHPNDQEPMTNDFLEIAVADTGIGIASEQHRLIFEAFQQADGGTARKYGGTGLGLSISKELARLLGGEIHLESEPGKGSTFRLSLPVEPERTRSAERGAEKEWTVPSSEFRAPTSVPDDRDSITESDRVMLIVEDDPGFAKVLIEKCHAKGFKCLAAATGEEGLDMAIARLPSAAVLDVRLPGLDGWSVLGLLKDDTRTRHIPVHVISVEDDAAESLRRGAVGHAVKPVTHEDLEAALGRLERIASGQPRRVLVVEDDPRIRAETVRLIGNGDAKADQAATGAEALAALRAGGYDCLVLDLGLPDMNGNELLLKLEREGVKLPPVIVHTARDLTREEEEALRERAESIVIKDVRSQERLLDEVSLFLHRVVKNMPEKTQKIIRDLHDTDEVLRDKKVLVVDDDMRTTFAVSRLLADRGMEPLKAENGARALRLLEENPDVALVLMDIMMPVMDGYETMKRIRSAERGARNVPIIALTAKAMPEDREKCLAAGANDYMTKPVDERRLVSMMRVWMCR